jgi:hypothetical protein
MKYVIRSPNLYMFHILNNVDAGYSIIPSGAEKFKIGPGIVLDRKHEQMLALFMSPGWEYSLSQIGGDK